MGLRELRKRSNITLEQLSALTGYDMPRLSRYETVDDDARNMFLGTAASLARIATCWTCIPMSMCGEAACRLASSD